MCSEYRMMKPRETAMRSQRHTVDAKSRNVESLERIIREFDQMAADLDRQIQLEEDRTGIRDSAHFSYSTFAKAAAQRRDNLRNSMTGLREKLAAAVRERDDAAEALTRATEQMEARSDGRHQRYRGARSPAVAR